MQTFEEKARFVLVKDVLEYGTCIVNHCFEKSS